MAKQKKKCPVCGATYKNKRCRSEFCTLNRIYPQGKIKNWRIWVSVALLCGQIGSCARSQGAIDEDNNLKKIGGRLYRHGCEAVNQGIQFEVPRQYAQSQNNHFNRLLDRVWPKSKPLSVFHATETLLCLIDDTKEYFLEHGYTMYDLARFNWLECALVKIQRDYDYDPLDYLDSYDDYLAFRADFWSESKPKQARLKAYEIGDRFAIAAYSRREARKILRDNTGLIGLPITGKPKEARIEFNGATTTYGALLNLFNTPGIMAVIKEQEAA